MAIPLLLQIALCKPLLETEAESGATALLHTIATFLSGSDATRKLHMKMVRRGRRHVVLSSLTTDLSVTHSLSAHSALTRAARTTVQDAALSKLDVEQLCTVKAILGGVEDEAGDFIPESVLTQVMARVRVCSCLRVYPLHVLLLRFVALWQRR